MPTYVYECAACETTFEAEQRMSEDPLTTCVCGQEGSVRRIIQPAAVVFNGTGFYVNDNKGCSGEPASCPSCSTES